jgi:cystathionine gamma-synthase
MPTNESPTHLSLATVAVTAGRPRRTPDAPLNQPLVLASTYHAPGEIGYGRYANPTWSAFEEAIGALEGGAAAAFGSGMAAAAAALSLIPDGSVVVAPNTAYLGVLDLLAQQQNQGRLTVRLVDITDAAGIAAAAADAALVWLESPSNPLLDVADLDAASRAAHDAGALLLVDNTFATPLLQRPLEHGADLVLHSATKYISGHADVMLGVVVAAEQERRDQLVAFRSLHGSVPGALEAYLGLRGLRTLHLRIERAQNNAAELVARLRTHAAVTRVRYAGFGAIVSIELAGGAAAADAVAEHVSLWVHATSLGGVESSLERRRRWPTERPEVPESLIRLSVGIEDVEDLWRDLDQALTAAPGTPL